MTAQIETGAAADPAADRALKEKHRAMWASGDYPTVAREVIPQLGTELVAAAGIGPGQRVLDVAAGSGNAAVPAAQAGADVVASDLAPELFEEGRRWAAEAGVDLAWHEGDAEALPYDDASFDTVISCVGVMFAPHHRACADEIARVTRPGGTIGLTSWTPEGFIGQMFATMRPYAPPPPPGAGAPPLWGDEAHVRELFGDRITDVRASRRRLPVELFGSAEHFRDYFKSHYGPTIAVYASLADDPDRAAALDRDLLDLARRFDSGVTRTSMEWEYLLFTARRS